MIHLPLKVQVTAEDIKNGAPAETCDCPQAIALSRATGLPYKVSIENWQTVDDGVFVRFRLPMLVREWIDEYDLVFPPSVQPIEWTIQESDRL